MLAIVGIVTLIWLGVMVLVSRFSDAAHYGFEGLRERATPYALVMALIPALLAMVGSLYYSEIAHYAPARCAGTSASPCTRSSCCWASRPARRDIGIRVYAIPLASIGAFISVYHLPPRVVPHLDHGSVLGRHPLQLRCWFRQFGFISMPFLALIAFLLVIAFLLLAHREAADESDDEADASGGLRREERPTRGAHPP